MGTLASLHIGCDRKKLAGFVNIDSRQTSATDVVCDAVDIDKHFRAGTVGHIYCRHMLEHVDPDHALLIMSKWYKVLADEGTINVVVPDLMFHAKQLLGLEKCEKMRDQFAHAIAGFYGHRSPSRGGNLDAHKWGYTEQTLRELFAEAGFVDVKRVTQGVDSEKWHLNMTAVKRPRVVAPPAPVAPPTAAAVPPPPQPPTSPAIVLTEEQKLLKSHENNVLIVASGHSANLAKSLDFSKFIVVAVNNGHLAVGNNFKWWIRPADYKGVVPTIDPNLGQVLVKSYSNELEQFGGHAQCGYSIVLCASYWTLAKLSPSNIFYLGCDMNYTPQANGATSIYGVGWDIKNRGISDPDRMVKTYAKGNDNYLNDIYMRFANIAKERGVGVFNLSDDQNTRLPYKKVDWRIFAK